MKLPLLLLGLLLLLLWPPTGHGRHHRPAVAGRVAPVRIVRSPGAVHRVKVVRAVR